MEEIAVEKGEVTKEQLKEIKEGRYYTIKQVANKVGYSTAWITVLCQQGRIKAIKPLGGQWRIPPEEWDRILKEGLSPLPRELAKPSVTEIIIPVRSQNEVAPETPSPKKPEERKITTLFNLLQKK